MGNRREKERRRLPVTTGHKTAPGKLTHRAYAIVRSYYAGTIDRRTSLGIMLTDLESEFAAHAGYDSLTACPVTLREKIHLAIGQKLFLMTFQPESGSKTGGRDLKTAENTLNRILTELGLEPKQRDAITLQEYIATKYGGGP